MRCIHRTWACALVLLIVPAGVRAADSWNALAEAAREARTSFQPVTSERVAWQRARFAETLGRLDGFLSRNPPRAEGWKRYLRWPQLGAEAAAESADPERLGELVERFEDEHQGLELEVFTSVRDAIRDYRTAALVARESRLPQLFEQQLDRLAGLLEGIDQAPTRDQAVAIGRILGWLSDAGQAEPTVRQVRLRLNAPNLEAHVSPQLLSAAVGDAVEEVDAVNELILGTRLRGHARLQGTIEAQLVPDARQAAFDILLRGNVHSRNRGYNGPVTVYSTGWTSVLASKRVYLTPGGLESVPATARCRTASHISDISARSRLIEKIAWKRARKTKGQVEGIAARRAERRIARRMDQEAAELIGPTNERYQTQIRAPLLRRNAFPQVQLASSSDGVRLRLTQIGNYQVAAAAADPGTTEAAPDLDLSVRVHESFPGNFSESLLGGRTLTDEKLVELLRELEVEIPDELQITMETDPWSITFANSQPVSVRFADQQVRIAIRGRRFTRGMQEVNRVIEIAALYGLEQSEHGARLVRQGDVQVEYLRRQRISAGEVAMKTFLKKKFESVFEPEIVSQGFQLQGPLARAGRFELEQLKAAGGWLALGWRTVPSPAEVAGD